VSGFWLYAHAGILTLLALQMFVVIGRLGAIRTQLLLLNYRVLMTKGGLR
jgi:hypothetical protein